MSAKRRFESFRAFLEGRFPQSLLFSLSAVDLSGLKRLHAVCAFTCAKKKKLTLAPEQCCVYVFDHLGQTLISYI